MYNIKQFDNDKWYICWPDGTKAWYIGQKSFAQAEITLKWFQSSDKLSRIKNILA